MPEPVILRVNAKQRTEFASRILLAILSNTALCQGAKQEAEKTGHTMARALAQFAYQITDAFVAEPFAQPAGPTTPAAPKE